MLLMTRLAARLHPHGGSGSGRRVDDGEGARGRVVRKRLQLEAVIDGDGITIGFPEDF